MGRYNAAAPCGLPGRMAGVVPARPTMRGNREDGGCVSRNERNG